MVRQDRMEKLAFARLMADLSRTVSQVAPEALDPIIAAYTHAVLRLPSLPPSKVKQTQQDKESKKLLDKVDRLTVADADLPPLPPKRGKRRR